MGVACAYFYEIKVDETWKCEKGIGPFDISKGDFIKAKLPYFHYGLPEDCSKRVGKYLAPKKGVIFGHGWGISQEFRDLGYYDRLQKYMEKVEDGGMDEVPAVIHALKRLANLYGDENVRIVFAYIV